MLWMCVCVCVCVCVGVCVCVVWQIYHPTYLFDFLPLQDVWRTVDSSLEKNLDSGTSSNIHNSYTSEIFCHVVAFKKAG